MAAPGDLMSRLGKLAAEFGVIVNLAIEGDTDTLGRLPTEAQRSCKLVCLQGPREREL